MGYAYTKVVVIYWKPDQHSVIHRYHHVWFDEYNDLISIEYKHTPVSLLLQKDLESLINNSDLLKLIPRELDILSTTFSDTTILTYEIQLPISVKKTGFNLLNDKYFIIPYVTDKIPSSPASRKHPKKAKRNVWIFAIS